MQRLKKARTATLNLTTYLSEICLRTLLILKSARGQLLCTTLHTVPESLYSFRFRFSRISVFYNRKFKKTREIAEFTTNQLRFHEKNFS